MIGKRGKGADLRAPFAYTGGKLPIAAEVWRRFGDVPVYVEPFAGSLAVLLARPAEHTNRGGWEVVNDLCGLISNVWRSIREAPEEVARWADNPVSEGDLHAFRNWLHARDASMQASLEADPDWYDSRAAGYYLFCLANWIGGPNIFAAGPWRVVDGLFVRAGDGMNRHLPHLGRGTGVCRELPHLGWGKGVCRELPHLGRGKGVCRKLPHLGNEGKGECALRREWLVGYMKGLADRLRNVRVCCGDWTRVCGPTPTLTHGTPVGVFLDPPYAHDLRDTDAYSVDDDANLSVAVRQWAIERGDDPQWHLALCGYVSEHEEHMPASWTRFRWHAQGGYGMHGSKDSRSQSNRKQECVWFSKFCRAQGLFEDDAHPTQEG